MSSMFDSVIVRERVVDRRLGGSALLVVFLHAAALVSVMCLTKPHLAEVTQKRLPPFVWLPPRAALPLLGGDAHPAKPTPHHPTRRDALTPPTKVTEVDPARKQVEEVPAASGPAEGVQDGDINGKPDGKTGGALDGTGICTEPPCGVVTGKPIIRVLPPDSPAPKMLSGPEILYPTEAIDHEVEGWMAVRCIITAMGRVQGCRVVEGLPFMNRTVIETLEARTYAPAVFDGQPTDIDYTFRLHFQLPP
jgi:hypothetical protein